MRILLVGCGNEREAPCNLGTALRVHLHSLLPHAPPTAAGSGYIPKPLPTPWIVNRNLAGLDPKAAAKAAKKAKQEAAKAARAAAKAAAKAERERKKAEKKAKHGGRKLFEADAASE